MRKREPLEIALVVLMIVGAAAIVTAANNQEMFSGIVYSISSVRQNVALRPGDGERIIAGTRSGAHYVLVDHDGVYPLEGDDERLGMFAGHKATIMGSYADGAIHVSTAYRSRVN